MQLLHLYDTEPRTESWAAWDQWVFTNAETVQLLQTRYPQLLDSVPAMTALISALHTTPPARLAAAHLITRASSPAVAAGFFHDLILAARPETAGPPPRPAHIGDVRRHCATRETACLGAPARLHHHQLERIHRRGHLEAAFGPDDPMPATRSVTTAPPPVAAEGH
ncbi:hypothetical protein ACFYOD_38875 [Streptomyces sp. NPDC006703]|uniref:hypothetical protein n=1 Tax=Streptomyces sp. NPDC006703 TaxID=3364759 RepID=UPI0036A8C03E